jgi:hypothetical protein
MPWQAEQIVLKTCWPRSAWARVYETPEAGSAPAGDAGAAGWLAAPERDAVPAEVVVTDADEAHAAPMAQAIASGSAPGHARDRAAVIPDEPRDLRAPARPAPSET